MFRTVRIFGVSLLVALGSAAPAQPPKPLQLPLRPHVAAGSALQTLCGSGASIGTGAHSPILPAMLHATQAPEQARLQQTPSAQKSDSHSAGFMQAAPSGRLPQLPAAQARLPVH